MSKLSKKGLVGWAVALTMFVTTTVKHFNRTTIENMPKDVVEKIEQREDAVSDSIKSAANHLKHGRFDKAKKGIDDCRVHIQVLEEMGTDFSRNFKAMENQLLIVENIIPVVKTLDADISFHIKDMRGEIKQARELGLVEGVLSRYQVILGQHDLQNFNNLIQQIQELPSGSPLRETLIVIFNDLRDRLVTSISIWVEDYSELAAEHKNSGFEELLEYLNGRLEFYNSLSI